ncbi:MAG TPA: hypothetical protein VM677_13785 [Actinokineospora sp.]|nr:hypothetical protein [Actinokineospora sp.]
MTFAPLRAASVDLETIALDAKANVEAELGKNSTAADGLVGFQSAQALRGCASAWTDHLINLVRETLDAGQKLASSVQDYEDLERRVAGALDAMDTGR